MAKYKKLEKKVMVLGNGAKAVYNDGERFYIRVGTPTFSGTYTNKEMKMQYIEITKPEDMNGILISHLIKNL